jgi:hypothetical protein
MDRSKVACTARAQRAGAGCREARRGRGHWRRGRR